ncbi:MAG: hypothetical protein Q9175_003542 [Cornicularia normoerica]
MSAANYYDKADSQEETSHFSPTSGQQPGPLHSGTQGYSHDMREGMNEQQQHQRGFPQQGYHVQSGNGIYSGQDPKMGNTNYAQGTQQMKGNGNYAQGAQQMEGHGAQGAQGAVADDRDTITKCNDNPPDYKKTISGIVSLINESFITLSNELLACAGLLLTAAVQTSLI